MTLDRRTVADFAIVAGVILGMSLSAHCQVSVSYSPQGATALKATVGKRVKGLQLVDVETCSTVSVTIAAGWIYQQAARLQYKPINPRIASTIVNHTTAVNWTSLLRVAIVEGTLIAAGLTSSGVITASKTVTAALVFAHGAGDQVTALVKPFAPDPSALLSLLIDPTEQWELLAGSCKSGMIAAVYPGGESVVVGAEVIPQPDGKGALNIGNVVVVK